MKKLLLFSITLVYAFSARAQLSGTYTIDPSKSASKSNYLTFSSAVSDLVSGTRSDGGTTNGKGVSGAVLFSVASGTYNERFAITSISGASSKNTITFTSAAGDSSKVILSQTDNDMVHLDGASWIVFKRIGFSLTTASLYNVINLDNGASNNTITNCYLACSSTSGVIISDAGATKDTGILIQNNYLHNGATAISLIGTSTSYENGNKVIGNLISGFAKYGVYLQYEDGTKILSNYITTNNVNAFSCIYVDNPCINAIQITGNSIYMNKTGYALYSPKIQGNSGNYVLVANNIFYENGKHSVEFAAASYFKFYNNNVFSSKNLGTGLLAFNSASDCYIYNNNLYTSVYIISVAGKISSIACDFNNYVQKSAVHWNGTTYTDIAALKTLGKDSNSVLIDPQFISTANLRATNGALRGLGKQLPEVTVDIDGRVRSKTPTIGANELVLNFDAGVTQVNLPSKFCARIQTISATIKNYGAKNMDSVSVNWSVNGKPQTGLAYTKMIKTDSSAIVSLGNFNFQPGGNIVKVWTSKPEGVTDSMPQNDTISFSAKVDSLPVASVGGNHSLCKGDSLKLGSSPVSGHVYSWTSKPSGFSSSAATPFVRPGVNTTYYLVETNSATGCSASDSATITVNPLPIAGFTYTNVCLGDTIPFSNTSVSAAAFSWHFGDGATSALPNPKHLYSKGNYNVKLIATNSAGCRDSVTKAISVTTCVWPGDANNDKIVDMNDFLAVGVAYGTKGHPRASASTSWVGQISKDWGTAFSNGTDYKHADANGDSIIDYKDTLAIVSNYGKTHTKANALNQGSPSDPALLIRPLKDSVYAGDTLKAVITIGTSNNQVLDLYGLKFSIAANSGWFDVKKAKITLLNSFLGTEKIDLMGLKIYNNSFAQWDLGCTRIDQKNASGFGNVAMISIPVLKTLPQKRLKTALSISDNIQITINEKSVSLYFVSDSFMVFQDKTGIDELPGITSNFKIDIYPNPCSRETNISYDLQSLSNVDVLLFDINGKQVYSKSYNSQPEGRHQLNVEIPNSGIYFLKFRVNGDVITRKVVALGD